MNYLKDLKLMHKKNRFTFGLHTEYLGYLTNEIVLKDEASPERIMACELVKQTINRLVCQLKEEIKMAFVLREMEGLSYEVIADIQDCPIGTVRSRIYRARESLNLALGESTFENESAFKLSKPKK